MQFVKREAEKNKIYAYKIIKEKLVTQKLIIIKTCSN